MFRVLGLGLHALGKVCLKRRSITRFISDRKWNGSLHDYAMDPSITCEFLDGCISLPVFLSYGISSSVSGGTCLLFIWSSPRKKFSLVLDVCFLESWRAGALWGMRFQAD